MFVLFQWGFLAFDEQQNAEIYHTVKGFQRYVQLLNPHAIYLRDVGSMGEIIFNETECLL